MIAVLPLSWLLALAGCLGLAVGSFLNVVVHRVPAGLSILSPPSACPSCRHEIRAWDNVPVVSWVLLRGRCRDCSTSISPRYPAVETATGLAFVLTVWRVQEPVATAAVLVVVGAGIALALIDLEHQRLPFAITGVAGVLVLAIMLGGVALGATPPYLSTPVLTTSISVGAWALAYGGIWLATAGRCMGLGDVALAPVLGLALALVGLPASVVGLAAGFLLGAVVGIALILGGFARRGTRVPHGPFMLAGAAVGVFAGDPLAQAYLNLVGLS